MGNANRALPGTVGTCVFVSGTPKSGRAACAKAGGDDPCATTVCDGLNGATCAGFVGPETACRVASCGDAIAVVAASCTGAGACPAVMDLPCAPFACNGTVCATACATDDDCDARYRCDPTAHACVAREGSSCDGDHKVNSQNGSSTNCAPYKCSGSSCLATCGSTEDCTDGNICNASGKCVPPINPTTTSACSSAATLGSAGSTSSSPTWLLGLLIAAGARSTKRRARGARAHR